MISRKTNLIPPPPRPVDIDATIIRLWRHGMDTWQIARELARIPGSTMLHEAQVANVLPQLRSAELRMTARSCV